jgi:hypothetical protein
VGIGVSGAEDVGRHCVGVGVVGVWVGWLF